MATVFTLALAARILGEDEDRIWALADQMAPEDGLVWVPDTGDHQTMAFDKQWIGPTSVNE